MLGGEYAFRMSFQNAGYVADIFRALGELLDEATFKVTSDSMRLVSLDPSRVCLIDIELLGGSAQEYRVERETVLTFNIQEALKFLKRARRVETLTLAFDDEERRLHMVFTDSRGRERSYTLYTLEPVLKDIPELKITYDARAVLGSDALKDAVEDAELVSDTIRVTIAPSSLIFMARGEMGVVENKLGLGALLYEVVAEGEVSANYSLPYLERIVMGGGPLSDYVTIQLSNNRPMKLTFTLPAGRLEYVLAPRVV